MSTNTSREFVSANTANLLSTSATDHTPTGASAFSDTLDLLREAHIIVHAAGALKVKDCKGNTVKLPALAVGVPSVFRVRRIFETDTDAGLRADDKVTLVYVP